MNLFKSILISIGVFLHPRTSWKTRIGLLTLWTYLIVGICFLLVVVFLILNLYVGLVKWVIQITS